VVPVLLTAIIFFATYTAIAVGRVPGFRIDRTGAALIGATALLVFRCITFEDAYAALNYRTLILLFGMMVVIANLRLSGFFRWVGIRIVELAAGPKQLLAAIILTTGVLSAFFVNDTVCLIFTPLVLIVCEQISCSPVPYLLALATASNIGSVATITGNPQNMIIGTFSHLSYRQFAAALAPVAVIGLVIDYFVIVTIYRNQMTWRDHVPKIAARVRVFRPLAIKSLIASVIMISLFFYGADVALVALGTAGAILITRRVKPKKVYREIDWELLMLFAGLFVILGAVEKSGLAHDFFLWAGTERLNRLPYLSAVVAILSNLVSNVPAVLLFQSFVRGMADPTKGWLVLAMASTLAGNLTIIGSIANLIVVEGAREHVRISFWEYCKVGIPLTLITLAIGILWLVYL
jgi:Na+/H+ antiporter NhaD/arsenite permease-like protein